MATNVVFTTPDPDNPKSFHAEVGGTATWKSNSSTYPKFQVKFTGPNPYNRTRNAMFPKVGQPEVVLKLNTAGEFRYRIKHIKNNDTTRKKFSGPFTLGVASAGQFGTRCPGCPPFGRSA
jgi:hypothetical protein